MNLIQEIQNHCIHPNLIDLGDNDHSVPYCPDCAEWLKLFKQFAKETGADISKVGVPEETPFSEIY